MNKVVLDTNVIVNFLLDTKGLEDQKIKAVEIMQKIESLEWMGYITVFVVPEVIWVFERYCKIDKSNYIDSLIQFLSLKNIQTLLIPKSEMISLLEKYKKSSLDLTDLHLISLSKQGYKVASFDKKLNKNLSSPVL